MSRMRFVFVGLALVLSGQACQRGAETSGDPKAQLRDYISASFNVQNVDDRGKLMPYLSGSAKIRLASWSDDQFKQAFIDSKRQFIKLTFREVKPVSEKEVAITYELTYFDQGKGHDAKVTNKKLAQMIHDENKWLISDVKNLKELIEYRNELALP